MRRPRSRVRTLLIAVIMSIRTRTLMIIVLMAAVLLMGPRSYVYYRLARTYEAHEGYVRDLIIRDRRPAWRDHVLDRRLPRRNLEAGGSEIAEYYATMARKYRRAMYLPFLPVAPDPPVRIVYSLGP